MKKIEDAEFGELTFRDVWEGAVTAGAAPQRIRIEFETLAAEAPRPEQREAASAILRCVSDPDQLAGLETRVLDYAYTKGREGFAIDSDSMPPRASCSRGMLRYPTIYVPVASDYDAAIEWSIDLVAGHGVRVLFSRGQPIGLGLGGDDEVDEQY